MKKSIRIKININGELCLWCLNVLSRLPNQSTIYEYFWTRECPKCKLDNHYKVYYIRIKLLKRDLKYLIKRYRRKGFSLKYNGPKTS